MPQAIYINLPVADVQRSRRFFAALGFAVDERLTSADAVGLAISDSIHVMLHSRESLKRFAGKPIADARMAAGVHLALRVESREHVNGLLEKALAAGGREKQEPQELGFIYGRAFEDPDGHIWEVFSLDEGRLPILELVPDGRSHAAPNPDISQPAPIRCNKG